MNQNAILLCLLLQNAYKEKNAHNLKERETIGIDRFNHNNIEQIPKNSVEYNTLNNLLWTHISNE